MITSVISNENIFYNALIFKMGLILHEIYSIINLIFKNGVTKNLAIACGIFSLIVLFISSTSLAILIISAYIFGIALGYGFVLCKNKSCLYLLKMMVFCKYTTNSEREAINLCSICDNFSCRRHYLKNLFPWKNLFISDDLNTSIERFLNKILEEFILSWYGSVTKDDTLIKELQYCLKYAIASIINRLLEVDISKIISSRLIPCTVKHVDDFMYIKQISKQRNIRINYVAVEYLAKRLHGAVTSRNNELTYLRELTGSLLPYISPQKYAKCCTYHLLLQEIISGWVLLPLTDALADPDVINSLIIILSNYKPNTVKSNANLKNVEFLKNFGNEPLKPTLFFMELNYIKDNTELLYTFMQFLKGENMVHLLQFCLDVDDFNKKLSEPEISKTKLETLYAEADNIQKEYLCRKSKNFIECSEKFAKDLQEILKDGLYCIAKIKISEPLIEAYKEVFNNLENKWLPLFYQSNEFYTYLCGPKVSSDYTKMFATRPKRNEATIQINPFKLPSSLGKIKSALKNNQPIEGAIYSPEIQMAESEIEFVMPNYCEIFRDISLWEISITSYVSIHKVIYFHIAVKKISTNNDDEGSVRIVLRKDQDFYTLKAKLVEFHGEQVIADSLLPMRRTTSDIGARMASYERFLRTLLSNPILRGSDLLYMFLTTEEDFSMFISTYNAPNQELGNLYFSMALKLKREKGQHLDSFLNNFLLSTKDDMSGKFDITEIGDEIDTSTNFEGLEPFPKTYQNSVFNNNFDISYGKLKTISTSAVNPINVVESFFYLGKHIFNIPNQLLKMYVSICNCASTGIETIWNKFLRKNLNVALAQDNLVLLIKFLEENIFSDTHEELSKTELENKKQIAKNILQNTNIPFLHKIFGNIFSNGFVKLWEISQHPHYNKQLIYQLLDIALIELYPDIIKTKE